MEEIKHSVVSCAAFLVLFAACEEPVDVEIESALPTLVVDGWVNNRHEDQVIKLSLSQSYFDSSGPRGVDDAEVSVTRSDGVIIPFDYTDNGQYVWSPISADNIGNVEDGFRLSINWNGDSYEAETTMNRVPEIDSIGQEFRDDQLFSDDGIYAEFFARDFVGDGDTYWIKTFKNGQYLEKSQELNIAYDAGFDAGTGIDGLVFIPPIREFVNALDEDLLAIPYQSGDEIRVEIHSISIKAFNFLEIARDQINNGDNGIFSIPLANTRTNVANKTGELQPVGFFNVAAVSVEADTIR